MKNYLVSIFILAISSVTLAQNNNGQSLLWEISGNNLKQPSYLYGTMHVSNKVAFHLGDTFFMALDQVEMIALETDPSTWIESVFNSDGSGLTFGLSRFMRGGNYYDNFYGKLSTFDAPDRKDLISALQDNHQLQNGFLYRSSMVESEYEENTYLDLFIYQYGRKNKIPVASLEEFEKTTELQILAMKPDEKDEKDKKKKKRKSFSSRWNDDMSVGAALEDAYRKGQINTIDSIMKLTARSENYLHYFLYERNKIMAARMDSIMQTKRLFTGIGAAHLAGEEGVIQLLRNMGYTLRPITSKMNTYAKQKKNWAEENFLPLNFSPYTASDGFFTVNVPNKLYETVGKGGDVQYFYPEMSNGGAFHIKRISTFSPLRMETRSKNYWIQKMDSLLFENIEGKILKEKKISLQGYPAVDITNKTRKGDIHRRIIVYTPIEIIVFKMSGTGEWVSKYGDQFFNSIQLHPAAEKENTFTNREKSYSIKFPATIKHNVTAQKLRAVDRTIAQALNPTDSSYFVLCETFLNDNYYIEEDSFEVRYLAEVFFEEFDSAKVLEISLSGTKQADAVGLLGSDSLFIRTLLVQNKYIFLLAKSDRISANRFFNSFQTEKNLKEEEYTTFVDSALSYQVSTPVYPTPLEQLLYKLFNEEKRNNNKGGKIELDRKFFHEQTKEEITVQCEKFSDYYGEESLEEFWEKELNSYSRNKLTTVSKVFNEENGIPTCTIIKADTGSTKVVEYKKLLDRNILYTLTTSYDSLAGRSPFIETFFRTFQPIEDTLKTHSILRSSSPLFFADLRSGDSLRIEKAINELSKVNFSKTDLDSIVQLIDNYEFPEEEAEETKIKLIREIGYLRTPKAIIPLSRFYEEADENHKIQFAVLGALANIKTKKSYTALKQLLIETPPIASSEQQVQNLFYYLDDSLPLTKMLFPELWDLALYEKYRDPLYKLTEKALDSSLISASVYKKYVPLILREAKGTSRQKKDSYSRISLDRKYSYMVGENRIVYEKLIAEQYYAATLMKLLIPHYKKSKSIQTYFNKVFQEADDQYRYIASIFLLKNNLSVPDSVFKALASSQIFMYPFYSDLSLLKKWATKNYHKSLGEEEIAKSIIYCLNRSLEPQDDSITFVKSIPHTEMGKQGNFYFFKSESSYNSNWKIHYVLLFPPNSTEEKYHFTEDFYKSNVSVSSEEKINEEAEKIIKELRLRNRKRAKKSNRKSYSDYDYDYEYDEIYEDDY